MLNYNKILFFVTAVIISTTFYTSCKKIKKLTNFYAEFSNLITIDPSGLTNSKHTTWCYIVPDTATSLFQENDSEYSKAQSVELSRYYISLVENEDNNLNFIDKIEVFMVNSESDELRIAWLDDIPASGITETNLNLTRDDLKNIMYKQFVIRIELTTNELIDETQLVNFNYQFYISTLLND